MWTKVGEWREIPFGQQIPLLRQFKVQRNISVSGPGSMSAPALYRMVHLVSIGRQHFWEPGSGSLMRDGYQGIRPFTVPYTVELVEKIFFLSSFINPL